jgi:hypothetical protein
MQDEKLILAFAMQEAEGLDVQLKVRRRRGGGDGYTVGRRGDKYVITGNNPRSCLYGVYHVRDKLGREGEFSTPWKVRGMYPCETLSRHTPEQIANFIDRMGKWRMNAFVCYTHYGYHEHAETIKAECAKRGIDIIYYHNTSFWFGRKWEAKKHFAVDAAGVPWTTMLRCETRPCWSDPAAEKLARREIDKFFRTKLPDDHRRLLFAPADGYKHCHCDRCRRLSPMEQWMVMHDAVAAGLRKHAPGRELHSQVYVHRYRPPAELRSLREVDRFFFDTHQRDRWHVMGQSHPPLTFHRENEVDWAARATPLNVYFMDRVKEWLDVVGKPITIFENLMVQGTFSCGQNNTSILMGDLPVLLSAGVDGMLYEAFETSIRSFADEFEHLSRAMWNPRYRYTPSEVESWSIRHFERIDESVDTTSEIGAMANLMPSVLKNFPWDAAERELEPVQVEFMKLFAAFNRDPSPRTAAAVVDLVLPRQDRFDSLWIGFWTLRRLFREKGIPGLTPAETKCLRYEKLWDFMEENTPGRKTIARRIESIRVKLKT